MSGHKALVINTFWAGILSMLIGSAILGGVAAYAQQVRTQEKVENLERAQLPTRLDKLETKVDSVKDQVSEVREAQREQNRKLDLVLQGIKTERERR